jgi:hypothetical protein
MEKKLKFTYDGGCDMLDALEYLAQELPAFGVKLELLDGGDGYEEVKLSKIEEQNVFHC